MLRVFRFAFLALLMSVLLAAPARAQQYIAPSWPNLMRTMVRFGALNLADTTMIDEYAIITECEMYKAFYRDDFKWNQVRQAVRQSIDINLPTFPINYAYDVKIDLDRYDFNDRVFRFTERSALSNVNTFLLYSVDGTGCGAASVQYMPREFRAVLAIPVYMNGLPLGDKDAQALLKQMEAEGNVSRTIYARFNLRIVYIARMQKITDKSVDQVVTHYKQLNLDREFSARLDAQLDSIDFYEDQERTKLIYQYKP